MCSFKCIQWSQQQSPEVFSLCSWGKLRFGETKWHLSDSYDLRGWIQITVSGERSPSWIWGQSLWEWMLGVRVWCGRCIWHTLPQRQCEEHWTESWGTWVPTQPMLWLHIHTAKADPLCSPPNPQSASLPHLGKYTTLRAGAQAKTPGVILDVTLPFTHWSQQYHLAHPLQSTPNPVTSLHLLCSHHHP